ncbi:MAG TPA: DNA repair protein RecN [Clostridiaceae bacterium]|nr:DNA repair protein RecN [Clostridiaceae bacterium]
MLIQLNVRNFALIDNLEIVMKKGYNILTGETGAGKSILIDSISFVLGGKFTRDFIRSGEESAYVEAVFTAEEGARPLLDSLGITYEDILILSRESFVNGRNTARVNGRSVLISTLRELGRELLDIHGQHNNQNLLEASKHIDYLDSFIGLENEEAYQDYQKAFRQLRELKERLQDLEGNRDRDKLVDYLKFQIEDIEGAKLSEEEEKDLEEKVLMLSNSEKLSTSLNTAYELLEGGDEDEEGILHNMNLVIKSLTSIAKVYEKVGEPLKVIEESLYAVEEAARDVSSLRSLIYFDADELNEVNERLHTYAGYKKKYGGDLQEVFEYLTRIRTQYEEIINAEEIIRELKAAIAAKRKTLLTLGKKLSELREKGGKALSERINREMKFVGLEKADFLVSVAMEDTIYENGIDRVNFLISTNLGEPKKPLEKVVSGGELSRIMLAMKVAFIAKDRTPSVIFNEIDTGISGRVAEAVGEKMYSLSKEFQVFCVTHLPQIAAFSDNHLVVEKVEKGKRTTTRVRELKAEEKAEEISKMIGGSVISEITISTAKDIIEKSGEIKKKYS